MIINKRIAAITLPLIACSAIVLSGCAKPNQTSSSAPVSAPTGGQPRMNMENMRYRMQMMGLLGGIRRLEQTGKSKLTADQAKQILAVIKDGQTKDKLSETNAKDVIRAVQLVLNENQRNEISAMMPERKSGSGASGRASGAPSFGSGGAPGGMPAGGPPSGGPSGGMPQGGPGGPHGKMGGRPPFDMDNMLKPTQDKKSPVNELVSVLEAKAK